jgi:hypothetical protein
MAKKGLEYKVGNIAGTLTRESKYIVCENGNSLVWYSANLKKGSNEEPYHKQIAESNGIAKKYVLGGGRFQIKNGILKVGDYSGDFGPVPKQVIDNFAFVLKDYLAKSKYCFKKSKIETFLVNDNFYAEQRKKWKKLGFE